MEERRSGIVGKVFCLKWHFWHWAKAESRPVQLWHGPGEMALIIFEMALALAEMALYATHVAGTLLHVLWERPEDMDVGCEWLLVYVRSSRVDCAGPASEHVVTLPLW